MSTGTPEDAKQRAATTYNAASDHYDDPANAYWERYGRRTVERLNLKSGSRLLDVCCGGGASAIPAAEAVGPTGSVLGIDLAENMLALGRQKAQQRGLTNIEFRAGDMLNLGLPEAHFDAVICVFGIFFVPDVVAATRELWRLVASGGKLAITTWGPRWSEPMSSAFWNVVRDVRPDLYRRFNPWDRITDPGQLRAVLTDAGVNDPDVVPESGTQPLPSPDDWWVIALGSGLRGTIDALDPDAQEYVRQLNIEYARDAGVREVETNVVYAVAHRHSEASGVRRQASGVRH
jgi:ubiquinone/menaquinone biosynthesis C-methylase UbiE